MYKITIEAKEDDGEISVVDGNCSDMERTIKFIEAVAEVSEILSTNIKREETIDR